MKLRQDFKRLDGLRDWLPNHHDPVRFSIAQKTPALLEVLYGSGVQAHQARTRQFGRNGIMSQHEPTQPPKFTLQRAVALHCFDPVRDYEMNRSRGANIQYAFMDAVPVQNAFRPAVLHPRNDAEHVLHTQRDSGPVMGLHLRHRNNEVRVEHSLR